MSRAEAARDDAEIRAEARAKRRFQLLGRVTDDDDLRWIGAQRDELAREKRTVQVAPVAANELAAGDDDERARQTQIAGGAFVIEVGVTSSCSGLPLAAPGITTIRPFSFATRFCGLLAVNQSRRKRYGRFVNGSW